MQAEIITIGDEILIGQILDTNSAFISKALNKIGVSVYQITSVQDDMAHIIKSMKEAEENADIIIITGGLGPTKDDITKRTICDYFQDHLVQSEAVLENIKHIWKTYIKQPLAQVNIDQALVPSKASVLMNKYGSAPGMWMEKNGKVFISLPGVPFEMKALMDDEVIPRLRETYQFPYIEHITILTHGLGESSLAERIEAWEDNLPPFIKLAYLPGLGRVRLRLSAKSNDREMVETEMKAQVKMLLPQIEDVFVSFETDESIEVLIGRQLTSLGKTLSIAESCTGGKMAQLITKNPGASKYFKGSVVTYASESKTDVLQVPEALIEAHSVVSGPVTEAMARRARELFKTDYAIATTGNAGPDKGDSDVEIGTVYIALATKDHVFSEKFELGNHRTKVIMKAVNKGFEMLQKEILKK
ncbi:CinA family nicotinamide mononucleotide deamidase-related protein [Bizionia argentinensis JUB59]|uniref:CinA-like protein n=1 Tax=Bizionia argentinensis JUB59 TaxID=1046627 RepID=G2EE59_9FLAO|nr:CinA family nicotinamide mononucleotide deamidase-related protein [Bizionia argentinensis]EGV43290.1 CinA family nicotinamide mononucleotide deamidase-related protein [Bizionia argentinensis JUB59]